MVMATGMEGITHADIPVANPAVVSRDGLDEGMVMVNCDKGAAIALNRTAGPAVGQTTTGTAENWSPPVTLC